MVHYTKIREAQDLSKDIFISYRNDGCSNQFAHRLASDLTGLGYSVYFNPNEQHSDCFPDRLKNAVKECKDFILVLSPNSIQRLCRNDDVDWVREEILTAKANGRHIIPVLVDGATMPSRPEDMPENLSFLPYVDAIKLPDEYMDSPFTALLVGLYSKQDGKDRYKDAFNSNPDYPVNDVFARLTEKAGAGDVEAMYELAMMHYYGVTSAEGQSSFDYEQAVYWLRRVSEADHPLCHEAENILARMYYNGTVPAEPQSYEKAMEYIERAAPYSEYAKGQKAYHLREGIGCEFDFQRYLDFLKEGMENGDNMRAIGLANFYIKYGKYDEAMAVYDSIENLTPDMNYQIGMLYRNGVLTDPPKPDFMQAAYYLRSAADDNHIMAAYEYGMLCFRPTGRFRKDFRSAQKYLQIAADGGLANAQYVLGFMYKSGHVTRDLPKAVEYLEKARAQGHSFSAMELASLYQQPEVQNYQRAYECATMAADHGIAEGEFLLAQLLFLGRGCEPDINKAYVLYSRAYDHGIHYASVMKSHIDRLKREGRVQL